MSFMKTIGGAIAAITLATATFAETPTLRASVLKFGTVNWELDVIKHNGFDTANGFNLEVSGVAGSAAAQVAFQGGETDVIVSDWLWVARQRAAGNDFVFIPYSRAVGGMLVPLGYVVKGDMLRDNPELVEGLANASRAAKDMLATDDGEWARLRERMNADTEAQFEALVAGFRAGIPAEGPIDEAAADKMLTLMYELGGPELLGEATTLPEGLFVQSGS